MRLHQQHPEAMHSHSSSPPARGTPPAHFTSPAWLAFRRWSLLIRLEVVVKLVHNIVFGNGVVRERPPA